MMRQPLGTTGEAAVYAGCASSGTTALRANSCHGVHGMRAPARAVEAHIARTAGLFSIGLEVKGNAASESRPVE